MQIKGLSQFFKSRPSQDDGHALDYVIYVIKGLSCLKIRSVCISERCHSTPQLITGSPATAMLSIEHSSAPRRMRKNPSSPHPSPQLFFTIQNFSPVSLSAPYPTASTA